MKTKNWTIRFVGSSWLNFSNFDYHINSMISSGRFKVLDLDNGSLFMAGLSLFYHNNVSLREIVLPKMNAVMLLVMKND